MRVERIPVEQISRAGYNPRQDLQPTDPEYQALQRSIERWDAVEPLVWNVRTGNLVSGHQRLKILLARGDSHVDVSVVDLDLTEEKALSVALNKISGRWDDPKLLELLSELDVSGIDVTLTGFEPETLVRLANELDQPLFTPAQAEVVTEHVLKETQVTRGDIQAEEQRQETRFNGSVRAATIKDVTCPSCGHEFGIQY